MARANQARLDLSALRHNVAHARTLAPHSKVMCVVKANAYGHGAVTIASALDPLTDALAVASIEEALELRESGIRAPILLLEGAFEAKELLIAAQLNFWVTISNEVQLQWLEQVQLSTPIRCWLKVDTGMRRLGVIPTELEPFYRRLMACRNAHQDTIIYTHFACADDLQNTATAEQLKQFEVITAGIPAARSTANSAGILGWPQSHLDWVRPGYMLYGNSPFAAEHSNTQNLRPVMTLSSAVIALRDVAVGDSVGYGAHWTATRTSRIATVSIGYGDGYPRRAPNGTPVLINGQRAPLAGRVSMDMITVDVTDLPAVQLGDEVTLWGTGLAISEIASHADTLGYELTTRMPARTPRIVTTG